MRRDILNRVPQRAVGGRKVLTRREQNRITARPSWCRTRYSPPTEGTRWCDVQCEAICAIVSPMTRKPQRRRAAAVNAKHRPHVLWLTGIFAVLTILLGIAPWHRQDWMLENVLVVLVIFILWAIYRYLPFSRLSWSLVFAFLCLHEPGAHYTYSEVPYESWLRWDRNNFDASSISSTACCSPIQCAKCFSISQGSADSGVIFSRSISPCPLRRYMR